MHERIYLESSAKRIGLSENRSSVCKPVNIVVAKPRVAEPRRKEGGRKEKKERKRNDAGECDGWQEGDVSGAKFFFPTDCRLGAAALTRAFLPP